MDDCIIGTYSMHWSYIKLLNVDDIIYYGDIITQALFFFLVEKQAIECQRGLHA